MVKKKKHQSINQSSERGARCEAPATGNTVPEAMTQQRITGGAEPARSKAVSGRERFSQGSLCVQRSQRARALLLQSFSAQKCACLLPSGAEPVIAKAVPW